MSHKFITANSTEVPSFIVINNRGSVCSDPYDTRQDAQTYCDELQDGGEIFYWVVETSMEQITRCGLGYEVNV